MITTGEPYYYATKTEVVDVVTGETCADLADFPLPNYDAVGAILDGTPIVCGGYFSSGYSHTCYKLDFMGWHAYASMKEKRSYAAGVVFQNKLHVFGGFYDGISQTSELISIEFGGVEHGPGLPIAVYKHAITSINSTESILSGGVTIATDNSPLTWYFNHETNTFLAGPSLLEGRYYHGSATCVDKVTKAKIPIAAGGYGNGGVLLDSTELLINGQWQSGTI